MRIAKIADYLPDFILFIFVEFLVFIHTVGRGY